MSYDKWCINCEEFILKVMLNGYHGICEKHNCLTCMKYSCDDFRYGKNKIYKKVENDEHTD